MILQAIRRIVVSDILNNNSPSNIALLLPAYFMEIVMLLLTAMSNNGLSYVAALDSGILYSG